MIQLGSKLVAQNGAQAIVKFGYIGKNYVAFKGDQSDLLYLVTMQIFTLLRTHAFTRHQTTLNLKGKFFMRQSR